jgi:hypothetical protein
MARPRPGFAIGDRFPKQSSQAARGKLRQMQTGGRAPISPVRFSIHGVTPQTPIHKNLAVRVEGFLPPIKLDVLHCAEVVLQLRLVNLEGLEVKLHLGQYQVKDRVFQLRRFDLKDSHSDVRGLGVVLQDGVDAGNLPDVEGGAFLVEGH